MAGKIGNWHREQLLKHSARLITFTPPSTLELYLATDAYNADGTGTQVPGSVATVLNNDSTVFGYSGGIITNAASAISTGVRATGGDQTVVSAKLTVPGQPTQVMYYGTLTVPVLWPQGQAFNFPIGELDIDMLAS